MSTLVTRNVPNCENCNCPSCCSTLIVHITDSGGVWENTDITVVIKETVSGLTIHTEGPFRVGGIWGDKDFSVPIAGDCLAYTYEFYATFCQETDEEQTVLIMTDGVDTSIRCDRDIDLVAAFYAKVVIGAEACTELGGAQVEGLAITLETGESGITDSNGVACIEITSDPGEDYYWGTPFGSQRRVKWSWSASPPFAGPTGDHYVVYDLIPSVSVFPAATCPCVSGGAGVVLDPDEDHFCCPTTGDPDGEPCIWPMKVDGTITDSNGSWPAVRGSWPLGYGTPGMVEGWRATATLIGIKTAALATVEEPLPPQCFDEINNCCEVNETGTGIYHILITGCYPNYTVYVNWRICGDVANFGCCEAAFGTDRFPLLYDGAEPTVTDLWCLYGYGVDEEDRVCDKGYGSIGEVQPAMFTAPLTEDCGGVNYPDELPDATGITFSAS